MPLKQSNSYGRFATLMAVLPRISRFMGSNYGDFSRLLWCSFVLVLVLANSLTHGQQNPPASNSTDYSTALEKLAELNIAPVPQGAKWVIGSADPSAQMRGFYGSSPFQPKHKGKGWFVPQQNSTGAQYVPMGACSPIILTEQEAKKMLTEKEIDLAADTALIIAAIEKIGASDSNELRSYFEYQGGYSNMAELMIFAARLHQMGKGDLANRVVTAIMGIGMEYQEKHIDETISLMANDELKQITNAFFTSYNWEKFQQQLQVTIKKYPRGWKELPAVIMLRDMTAKRKNPPPVVKIQNSEHAALIEKIHESRPSNQADPATARRANSVEDYYAARSPLSRNWILFPPSKKQGDDVVTQLQAKGLAAIPSLVALLGDEYPTYYQREQEEYGSRYYSSSDVSVNELFSALARPMTRGEIAVTLLANILPDSDFDSEEIDPEEIGAMALEFHKKMQNADEKTLLIEYMQSAQYQSIALERLSKSDDPNTIAALEKFILAADSAVEFFDTVMKLMKSTKKPSKEFVAAYRAKLQEQNQAESEQFEPSGYSRFQSEGGIKSLLSKLDSASGNFTPSQLMMKIVMADDKKWQDLMELFQDELPNLKKDEAILLCLKGATTAMSGEKSASFLQNIYTLDDDDEEKEEEKPREIPEAELNLWKKVLTTPKSYKEESLEKTVDVPTVASYALEYSVSAQACRNIQVYRAALPVSVEQFFMQRGLARVNKQPLPEMPDPKKVTKERFAEIIAALVEKSPLEVHEKIAKLSPDEIAAWIDWIANPTEPTLPESVKNAIFVVTGRSDYTQLGKDDPTIDGLSKATILNAETLLQWSESISKNMETKSPSISMGMIDHTMKVGIKILSCRFDFSSKKEPEEQRQRISPAESYMQAAFQAFGASETLEAVTILQITRQRESVVITWEKEAGKVERVDDITNEKIAELFHVDFENLSDERRGTPWYMNLSVLTRADYKKFQEAQAALIKESEDEDEEESEEE